MNPVSQMTENVAVKVANFSLLEQKHAGMILTGNGCSFIVV